MSELVPPQEANSPDLVIQREIQRYVEGLTVGDLRFTVFHDYFSVYNAQREIFEFEDLLDTAHGADRVGHESDKRVAENRYAIAQERQEDRWATVPDYYREYVSLAELHDKWREQYKELSGADEDKAQATVVRMMRYGCHKVLDGLNSAPTREAVE